MLELRRGSLNTWDLLTVYDRALNLCAETREVGSGQERNLFFNPPNTTCCDSWQRISIRNTHRFCGQFLVSFLSDRLWPILLEGPVRIQKVRWKILLLSGNIFYQSSDTANDYASSVNLEELWTSYPIWGCIPFGDCRKRGMFQWLAE